MCVRAFACSAAVNEAERAPLRNNNEHALGEKVRRALLVVVVWLEDPQHVRPLLVLLKRLVELHVTP